MEAANWLSVVQKAKHKPCKSVGQKFLRQVHSKPIHIMESQNGSRTGGIMLLQSQVSQRAEKSWWKCRKKSFYPKLLTQAIIPPTLRKRTLKSKKPTKKQTSKKEGFLTRVLSTADGVHMALTYVKLSGLLQAEFWGCQFQAFGTCVMLNIFYQYLSSFSAFLWWKLSQLLVLAENTSQCYSSKFTMQLSKAIWLHSHQWDANDFNDVYNLLIMFLRDNCLVYSFLSN